jgi:hypothetical protein
MPFFSAETLMTELRNSLNAAQKQGLRDNMSNSDGAK